MKAKSKLLLVFGITFFLFSCNSDDNSTPEESEIPPIQRDCSFSQLYADQIEYYKKQIPVLSENLDTLFMEWSRHLTLSSDPFAQVNSIAYPAILNFCLKHGKAILPLVIEKVVLREREHPIALLKDLTFVGEEEAYWSYMDSYCNITKPTTYLCQKMIPFCAKLLENEEENILKTIIQNLFETENETFEANEVTVSNQGILINLNSEKSETAIVKIYNIAGGIEFESNYSVLNGEQTVVIDASNFKKGIYVVQITIGGKTTSQKIRV